jgi:hypothetical protein
MAAKEQVSFDDADREAGDSGKRRRCVNFPSSLFLSWSPLAQTLPSQRSESMW